ncbi:MAG: pilus assembly protein TadG-related protein [Candidatus Omnitrophota bacterium]
MKTRTPNQNGSVIVLATICMTLIMMAAAMTIDVGLMAASKSQLQNAADSAALAGAAQLVDEGALAGTPDQTDDVISARNFAQEFAGYNEAAKVALQLDRNDGNLADGGIVAGYLQNPLDMNSLFQSEGVSQINSIKVSANLSQDINGPLALLMGAFDGPDSVEISTHAIATIDDRIAGFSLGAGETLPMLPFAAYEGTWNASTDGVSDQDNFRVVDGVVSSGSDGIPEITLYPYKYYVGIPGTRGNVGTIFVSAVIGSTYVQNQIANGMNQEDLAAIDGLEMTDDGSGDYAKWLPGENWMSSSWHTALRNIKGQARIMPLFRSFSSSPPIALANPDDVTLEEHLAKTAAGMEEICCAIQYYYETVKFEAVTVIESYWPSSDSSKRFIVQPAQMTTEKAIFNPDAPSSGLVYTLSLTR